MNTPATKAAGIVSSLVRPSSPAGWTLNSLSPVMSRASEDDFSRVGSSPAQSAVSYPDGPRSSIQAMSMSQSTDGTNNHSSGMGSPGKEETPDLDDSQHSTSLFRRLTSTKRSSRHSVGTTKEKEREKEKDEKDLKDKEQGKDSGTLQAIRDRLPNVSLPVRKNPSGGQEGK